MSAVLCPACRHPTRKHDSLGCTANNGACDCDQTRATLAAYLDELVPVAAPATLELPPPPEALVQAKPVLPPSHADLPGPDPAPAVIGHGAAEPIRGGEAEPIPSGQPAAEATTPASAAGRVPLGTSWLCRPHRDLTHPAPGRCPHCGEPLERHHIYAERAADG